MRKKLAIFIPAYNASGTILETLVGVNESAIAAGLDIPVYIVDDCSKDNTLHVLRDLSFSNLELSVQVNKSNLGERGTINLYFDQLKNLYDWVFLIHADDIPKASWLQDMKEVIDHCDDEKYFTVWSSFDSFNDHDGETQSGDDNGEVVFNNRQEHDALFYLAKVTCSWHVSGAAFNMRLFDQIGGFDTTMPQYGDTDYFVAGILAGYSDIYIRKTLTKYRVITTSVSFVSKKTNRDIKEMFYLIEKYDSVLRSREKSRIMALALRFAAARLSKYMMKGKMSAAMEMMPLTFSSLLSYSLHSGKAVLNVR